MAAQKTEAVPEITTIIEESEEPVEEKVNGDFMCPPKSQHHSRDNLESFPEERNHLTRFLEFEHEEKVELEMSRSKGLVISPSNAFLNNLVSDEYVKKDLTSAWKKYKGIIFGISASLFFSLSVMMVKLLHGYDELNVCVWRYCGIFVPSIPIVMYYELRHLGCCQQKLVQRKTQTRRRQSIFRTVVPLYEKEKFMNFIGLMLRGLLGCTSVLLRFYSLKYLSIADSAVISYSGSVFVVIVAHFCLGEKCGFVPILAAVLTVIGVCVIARPPIFTGEESFDMDKLTGVVIALMSMMCNSTVIILMRKIRKVHFAVMLLTFGSFGVAESFIVAASFGVLKFPAGGRDSWLMLFVLPTLVFFGQMSIILATKHENAGPISLIRSCDVLFAFLWQLIFLDKVPEIYSLIGGFIVILCVAITTIRKWVSTLPPDSLTRKRFKVFLL